MSLPGLSIFKYFKIKNNYYNAVMLKIMFISIQDIPIAIKSVFTDEDSDT